VVAVTVYPFCAYEGPVWFALMPFVVVYKEIRLIDVSALKVELIALVGKKGARYDHLVK
jgi:hypothetical protein